MYIPCDCFCIVVWCSSQQVSYLYAPLDVFVTSAAFAVLLPTVLLLQDEEELEWLAVAKEGKGVTKSERRQESAETEYHRLLCEESIQQASIIRSCSIDYYCHFVCHLTMYT